MGHGVRDCPKKGKGRREKEVHNIEGLAEEDEFKRNVTLRDDFTVYIFV